IQAQLQSVLNNYFDKNSYVVNVKVYLERIKAKDISKPKQETEELFLPGLPSPLKEEVAEGKYLDKVIAESLIFTDKFRIKNIEVVVLLDQEKISLSDGEFIKTVIDNLSIINKLRGDEVIIKRISFPPPLNIKSSLAKEDNKMPEWVKEIYPYIYYGSIILLSLIFLIILLQIISIIKTKHEKDIRRLETAYAALSNLQVREKPPLPGQKLSSLPQSEPPSLPTSTPSVQERKDLFYELRQLMVTTLVGNPEFSAEIFKNWINTEGDNGIYQIASFLKATDPKLMEVLSEYFSSDVVSKIEFAMNQIISMDTEGVIEIFKRFREEFQKEQTIRGIKGPSTDLFHFLRQLEPHQVFHIIKDEPPGIIAIVLAQLSPELANNVLLELPENRRNEIILEMGKMKKIPVSAYREIADRLTKKALQVEKIKYVATDGVEALIKLLEESSPEVEEQILSTITAQDVNLANEIRKVYITFSELTLLPDKILAEILRGIDRDIITKALIDADPTVKQKIISNLPPRLRLIIPDLVKTLEEEGGVSVEEIFSSRKSITRKIRELVRSGKLDLKRYIQ
ncbi:MAG: hypothetical protein NZ839_03265, partial [Endomicrobia bacterium]|nr:hypothetical protein [Endomicrobiia bacterium]